MARIINVTLSFAVDTDLMSVDSIIDNLDFRVTENSENVEVVGGLVQVEDFFEVYQEPTAPKTKQELIDAISEKLSQAEDEKIVLDEDNFVSITERDSILDAVQDYFNRGHCYELNDEDLLAVARIIGVN